MFSIIVPVHNVEDYIDECIKSIIMQSYRKFELILVVNASVDESYNICKDWEMKDDRVLVIHTDISGVSHARNLGIKKSQGEWIVFVDADDYLLEDALLVLFNNLDYKVDAVVANYTQKNVSCNLSNEESFISSKEYLLAMLDSPYYFDKIESKMTYKADVFGVNWGKAFKKSIINDYNLQFNEKITIFEDFLFNFDFFTRASKVKCVDTPIYFYRVTRGSLSRTESVDRVLKRMDFINLLSEKEVSEYLKDVLDFCVMQNILRMIVAIGRNKSDYKELSKIIFNFLSKKNIQNIITKSRKNCLSNGKYHNYFYIIILELLKKKWYRLALKISTIYCKIKHKD